MLEKFIYAKKKSLFKEALNRGEILDDAIAFIKDTKEIWTHGLYFETLTDNFITEERLAETLKNFEDDIENISTALTVKGNVLAIDTEEELDDIPKLEGKLIIDADEYANVDTVMLTPNKYYIKTKPNTNLTILFYDDGASIINEYCIEFVTAEEGTSVTLPEGIKWLDGEIPEFENDCTYLISVIRGLGVCAKFS